MDQESLEQIRQILTEATQGLRSEMQTGLTEVRQEMNAGLTEVRREIQSVRTELGQEIIAASEENKRHAGVLHEDLQHKLELVIEGQQVLRHEIHEVSEKVDRESRDTRALLKASYQELHQRVERLEQRS